VEFAKVGDIPAGKMKSFVVVGKDVLVIDNGLNFYAIGRYRAHLHGALFRGKREGKTVTFPRHGSPLAITPGRYLVGPVIGPQNWARKTKQRTLWRSRVKACG